MATSSLSSPGSRALVFKTVWQPSRSFASTSQRAQALSLRSELCFSSAWSKHHMRRGQALNHHSPQPLPQTPMPNSRLMMSQLATGDCPDELSSNADAVIKSDSAEEGEEDQLKFEYEPIEDIEHLERYKPGGYHPLILGDMLHNGRYRIIHKLGHGTYSTNWLASDQETNKNVAIKICTADSSGASQERAVLGHLRQLRMGCQDEPVAAVTALLDEFHLDGPNGGHDCIVTKLTRMNIQDTRETSRCYGLLHVPVARAVIAQLVHAVAFCHENGVVHGDIYLNNIMFHFSPGTDIDALSQEALYERFGQPITLPVKRLDGAPLGPGVPEQVVGAAWLGCASEKVTLADSAISLADFGAAYMVSPPGSTSSSSSSRGQQQHAPPECHTPLRLRPPEARFAPSDLGPASDVWTLACTAFEIAGSAPLFFGSFFLTEDSVTGDWVDALGRLPDGWWTRWGARAGSFSDDGERLDHSDDDVRGSIEHRFERRSQEPRRGEGMDEWAAEETAALLGMFKAMLKYKPAERISVAEVLGSEWMLRWGMPALKEMKMAQEEALSYK